MQKVNYFQVPSKIISGVGAVERVGEEAKRLGARKALIVTQKGILSLADNIMESLHRNGIAFEVFDDIEPEPSIETADTCGEHVRKGHFDLVVGIGGGSVLDVAKAGAMLGANEGSIRKYIGIDLVPKPGLPSIMIPTTAGTGSEQSYHSILFNRQEKSKQAVISSKLFTSAAIVDPVMTVPMPQAVTAASGMDALVHAIEAYVSVNAYVLTNVLAIEAIEMIASALRSAYANGQDVEARYKMVMASLLAGMADCNAGTGAVHAAAYPLGGTYQIPHGTANGLMLPYVMEYNLVGDLKKFSEIAGAMGQPIHGLNLRDAAISSVAAVRQLSKDINMPQRLRELNVPERDIPTLAEDMMKVTRLLANNPRKVTLEDAKSIYANAW